jgi:hypothetical protein
MNADRRVYGRKHSKRSGIQDINFPVSYDSMKRVKLSVFANYSRFLIAFLTVTDKFHMDRLSKN